MTKRPSRDDRYAGMILQTGQIVLHDTAEALQSSEVVRKAYLGEE